MKGVKMEKTLLTRTQRLKAIITDFLNEKLGDSSSAEDHELWLQAAADKAQKLQKIPLQAVTHIVKTMHPDADGTSGFYRPSELKRQQVVGSHCLVDKNFKIDAVANAADLGVVAFLWIEFEGTSLLELSDEADADFAAALSQDLEKAHGWLRAFKGLLEPKGHLRTHTLAKQLFWPAHWGLEHDPLDAQNFHLLEPLHASILSQHVHEKVQADRFNDTSKPEREAKKQKTFHENPVHEYRDLAIQKIGGSNAQNISYLNAKRRGANYLFASVPPQWVSQPLKPLLNTASMFGRYGRRAEVKTELRVLLKFLKTDPPATLSTRNQRAQHVNALLLDFLQFTSELRELESGWVAQPECKLKAQHAFWLNPEGAAQHANAQNQTPPTDVLNVVSEDFALWFNHQLQGTPAGSLPVGDPEYNVWRKLCEEALKAYERGGLEEAMRWLDIQADELADTTAQNAKQEVAHA